MIFLDTGYFIAVLNPHDALHVRAEGWSALLQEPLLVTEYVVWETVNFFSAAPDRPKARAFMQYLRSARDCKVVQATPQLLDAGLKLHAERADKDWSLTDCISFVVMDQEGIARALAYDLHFEQAGFEALLRRDPLA